MKIKSVRLQNIKSYRDETIVFNDGVNFISGINGAGKTTLIESIGYGLFDRKPGIIKEFIRYGSGTGTITIEFEANDERLYRVVRKCGNVNSWVVFDVESDSELDLHAAADVKPWLKEIMGIDREQDLSQLFEDIIGVGQGTFTAPFLDTPAGRRDKFNKMLKVEVYREAHSKTKSTVRFIEDKLQEAKLEMAKLQGSISEYDSIKEKRENLKPVIEILSKELAEKKVQRDKKAKIREELRGLSAEIQKFQNNINIQEITLKNLMENENKLNDDLSNSQHSRDMMNKSEAGFSAYKDAQKKLEGLEKHRTVRDALVNALTKTKQSIGEILAGINSGNENVKAQETEVKQKLSEYSVNQKQQEADACICSEKFSEIRILEEKFTNSESLLDKFENYKKRFDLQNTKCDSVFVRLEELSTNEDNLREKLSQESKLVAKMEKIKALESKRDQLLQKTAAVESEIKTLESNREKTWGGKCPFLDAPCKNVGGDGDLNKFFYGEIEKRDIIKAEYCQELEEIEKLIAQGGPIRIKLGEIEGAKVSLKGMEEEKKKYENILSEYRENIRKYFIHGIVEDLYNAFKGCLSDMAVLVPENDNRGMLEKLNVLKKSFTDSWYNFEALHLKEDISDSLFYKNLIGDFTIVLDRAGEMLDWFKSTYRHLAQAISKEKAYRNGELVKVNEAIENTKKNIRELFERQKKN